jgi:enoyl-CoA hydratase/carnithine racemase
MSNHVNEDRLLYEERGATAIITINRPRQRNTLSISTLQELTATFAQLAGQEKISIIILTGLGEAFAAGADINELLALQPATAVDFSQLGGTLFETMRHAPQLIIAAIDGYCLGGGLDLALACDLRYASAKAVFAHPGANIGIITGFGGTKRLPAAIGETSAQEFLATAERINGQRAFEIGLVQAYCGETSALEFAWIRAQKISQQGSAVIKTLKRVVSIAGEDHPARELLLLRYGQLIAISQGSNHPD